MDFAQPGSEIGWSDNRQSNNPPHTLIVATAHSVASNANLVKAVYNGSLAAAPLHRHEEAKVAPARYAGGSRSSSSSRIAACAGMIATWSAPT